MRVFLSPSFSKISWIGAAITLIWVTSACSDSHSTPQVTNPQFSDGPPPDALPSEFRHPVGNVTLGREVFRFETFGNERFWTDAARLPQGLAAAGVTPLQALRLGLNVNVEALNQPTVDAVSAALVDIAAGAAPESTVLGDPAVTLSLINQNAVQGVVAFDPAGNRKPTANTTMLDLAAGDRVGLSCALCHAVTDNSVLPPTPAFGTTGSIGRAIDGPTPHGLDVGAAIAIAERSLAYYPMLQLRLEALGGTIGRGDFPGLARNATTVPTEAEADEYLTGGGAQRFYPVGQFDAFPDGVGNPLHIAPFFRTDLSAPWGIDGGVAMLQDFNNTVFTVSLDPTSLLTDGGRQFLEIVAGPVGTEIADDYEQVMRDIGVLLPGQQANAVFPFVNGTAGLTPGAPGSAVGRRVDETGLIDLNAYLDSLPAPAGANGQDAQVVARGREVFRRLGQNGARGCTECHHVDGLRFVPPNVVPMETMYPGYAPTVLLDRMPPLSDVQNSAGPSPFFDDRMIVLDASRRGEVRGVALPLLLDLDRRATLLHDDSVSGSSASFRAAAQALLDPARGPAVAHPFYVEDPTERTAVIEFLRSLGR